jgi:nitronate monooxygenase
MLALRASGAVMGTRFLLTPESLYTDAQRQALVAAKSGSTIRTMAFDRARGTLGWPDGVDGRALRNSTVDDLDGGVNIEEVRSKFELGVQNGDPNRMLVWAGTGVGQMTSVTPAQVGFQSPRFHIEIYEVCALRK